MGGGGGSRKSSSVSGGSSGSGKIEYPDWMEAQHTIWLADVDADMDTAMANNPYADVGAYNPSDRLDVIDEQLDAFIQELDSFDPVRIVQDAMSEGQQLAEGVMFPESIVDDVVKNFANRQTIIHQRTVNRFAQGMADMNAVQSSTFVSGRSMLDNEFNELVGKFNADLTFQNARDQVSATANAAGELMRLATMKFDARRVAVEVEAETQRVMMIAEKQQWDSDVSLNVNDTLWDLSLYSYGQNVMSSISGSAVSPGGDRESMSEGLDSSSTSRTGAVMSGAAAGASAGAMSGTGWGAAIGAVIGGAAGYYGSG